MGCGRRQMRGGEYAATRACLVEEEVRVPDELDVELTRRRAGRQQLVDGQALRLGRAPRRPSVERGAGLDAKLVRELVPFIVPALGVCDVVLCAVIVAVLAEELRGGNLGTSAVGSALSRAEDGEGPPPTSRRRFSSTSSLYWETNVRRVMSRRVSMSAAWVQNESWTEPMVTPLCCAPARGAMCGIEGFSRSAGETRKPAGSDGRAAPRSSEPRGRGEQRRDWTQQSTRDTGQHPTSLQRSASQGQTYEWMMFGAKASSSLRLSIADGSSGSWTERRPAELRTWR
jgi:hypothetical protein